jgi:hypothetical protein
MYEEIDTGPIYDELVQWMSTYRSLQARMWGAKHNTQKKIDDTLEKLGERIDERITELTDTERMALDCWKHGILPGVYEMDREALMQKPYVSIRKIERWDEEHHVDDVVRTDDAENDADIVSEQLRGFLDMYDD